MIDISKMNQDQLKAALAQMTAENAALKAQAKSKLSLKVGEKGNVLVRGLGRWPVTLYKSQWLDLLELDIAGFIKAHEVEIDQADKWWTSLSETQQAAYNKSKQTPEDSRSPLEKAVDQMITA